MRRPSTSWTARGRSSPSSSPPRSGRVAARRAYSTRKNGFPSVRRRSASVSCAVGCRCPTRVEDAGDRRRVQPGQLHLFGVGAGEDLGGVGQGPGGRRSVAPGRHQQQALGRGLLHQQPEDPEAGGVGPVQVVEDDQHQGRRGPPRARCGRSATSTANSPPRAPSCGRAPGWSSAGAPGTATGPPGTLTPSVRSASSHGHNGGAPSSWEQRPTSTVAPRARARAASSAQSRLLPMPGSPVMTPKPASPASARSSRCTAAPARRRGRRAASPAPGPPFSCGPRPEGPRPAPPGASASPTPRPVSRGSGLRSPAGADQNSSVVLREDPGLQVAQLGPGVEPQLVGEHRADASQRVEGVGLATGADQRQHPQRPQPLAQRVLPGQGLELGRRGGVVTERQPSRGPVLQGDDPQLLEVRPLGQHAGRSPSSAYGCPRHEAERLVEGGDRGVQVVGRHRARAEQGQRQPTVLEGDGLLEAGGVAGLRAQAQRVARGLGDQDPRRGASLPLGLEDLAQPGHVGLDRGQDARRRALTPEQVDQGVDRHRVAGREGQRRQQGSLPGSARFERRATAPEHQRPENAQLQVVGHRRRIRTAGTAREGRR